MKAGKITFTERMVILQHEVTTAAIIVGDLLDGKDAEEADFSRLVTCLHRLRALQEVRP